MQRESGEQIYPVMFRMLAIKHSLSLQQSSRGTYLRMRCLQLSFSRGAQEAEANIQKHWIRIYQFYAFMPIKILSMYSPVGLLSSQSFCNFFNNFLGIFRRFFRTLSIYPDRLGEIFEPLLESGQIQVTLGSGSPDRFWRLPGQGSSPIIRGPVQPWQV